MNKTVQELTIQMNNRMAQFEAELAAARSSPATATITLDSLASEFNSFRLDVIQSLNSVQSSLNQLSKDVDRLEMRTRQKILLLHGVPEGKDEVSLNVAVNCLNVCQVSKESIGRCHRMGRAVTTGAKPRPLLVKFRDLAEKDRVWLSKKQFKGSNVTISEFLTVPRHKLFMTARARLGVSRCWTRDGHVYCTTADGKRVRISSLNELDAITGTSLTSGIGESKLLTKSTARPQNQQLLSGASKMRRAAATAGKK